MSTTTAPEATNSTAKNVLIVLAAVAVALTVWAGITGKRGAEITPSDYVTTGGANLAPQVRSDYPASNQR